MQTELPIQEARTPRRLILLLLVGIAFGVCGWAIVGHVRQIQAQRALQSPNPQERIAACRQIVARRIVGATERLVQQIAIEQDRPVLEFAGYALMRLGDVRNGSVRILLQRAAESPDDRVRAKLLTFSARLSRRHPGLHPLLLAGTSDLSQPWRQAGSAAALLQAGDPRGGAILIELACCEDQDIAGFAYEELRRVAEVMCQGVGFAVPWPSDAPIKPEMAGRLREFWNMHASSQLLADALNRLEYRDKYWHQTNRLIHARKRVSGWLF